MGGKLAQSGALREDGMLPLERHKDHIVPADEIRRRIANLQALLRDKDLALAWIDHLTDRYYFTGSVQDGTLLVPAAGEPAFHVRKSQERARAESPLPIVPFAGRTGLIDRAQALLGAGGRVGVALDVMPAPTYLWLTSKLGAAPVDVSADIRLLKAVKSAWEIEQVRAAAGQGAAVLAEVPRLLRAGMTELELSAEVERRLRLRGHPGPLRIRRPGLELGMMYAVSGDGGLYPTNFDGPDGAEGLYPGAASGSGLKVIAPGETVMVDMVSSFNGYQADTTRVFCVGRDAPAGALRAHRFCMDVLARLEANLRPGRICSEVYEETLAWAERQGLPEGFMGFKENRVKFFGHGVGLDLDEFPIIASKIGLPLAAGMVVALEPKAFLAGIGPVGVENTYVITESGCECLCPLPWEIVCVE
jgi:Xaa-Pro dipeptidase